MIFRRFPPRWHHLLFLCYVMVMTTVFLLPVPAAPFGESTHIDKLVHFGIFLGFALLYHLDRRLGARRTFLTSVAFAGGIELLQHLVPYREGDWLDFAAGTAGAALGVVFVFLLGREVGPGETRSSPPPATREP
jgi:VanZ family protein